MKRILFVIFLFFSAHIGYGQSYIPMPADSAIWRYRMYNIDYEVQVTDCILYVNGSDTVKNGKTYHKIFSRSRIITVPVDSFPPITTAIASNPDSYYGAIRDSGQQVFLLTISGEEMMYDFTAAPGGMIPAYSGTIMVTVIDSVLLGGVYHRRFLTTDSTYYVIEGVGSNRGLITNLNALDGTVQFCCFTDTPAVYAPDSAVACTYVYPLGYASVRNIENNEVPQVDISPVPAYDVLHITTTASDPLHIVIYNSIRQLMWQGTMLRETDIHVALWAKGVYYMQSKSQSNAITIKKLVIE